MTWLKGIRTKYELNEEPGKARGMTSLPGGYRNYVDTITKLLKKIELDSPSRSDFVKWLKGEYNLKGYEAPKSYLHTLLDLELVRDSMKGLQLSEIGKDFLKTRNKETILVILIRTYAGIKDVLTLLFRESANLLKIHDELEKSHNFRWKTPTQTIRRLRWLRGLGYVGLSGKNFFLTDEGRGFMSKFLSRNERGT